MHIGKKLEKKKQKSLDKGAKDKKSHERKKGSLNAKKNKVSTKEEEKEMKNL